MKNALRSVAAVAIVAQAGLLASTASAQYTWTGSVAPAPTYSNTLNFDEAPLPAGAPGVVASNAYVSRGVSAMNWIGGGGVLVNSGNTVFGTTFMPTNNQAVSNAYIEFYFAQDVNQFSAQFWDSAPNASPTGSGGARIDLYNNGVMVNNFFISNPFWTSNIGVAGTLPTWFNVVTAPGVVFDQVVFNGFGLNFGDDNLAVDNLSWNTVPTPGAAALLGMGGLFAGRRRR